MKVSAHNEQVDRVVQASFAAPVPAETRTALQDALRGERETWRSRADATRPGFAIPGSFRKEAWLAAAACVLIMVLGATHLTLRQARKGTTGGTRSYACAIAHKPVPPIRCTAVFYSKEDPSVWVERHSIVRDRYGKSVKVSAYNQKGS